MLVLKILVAIAVAIVCFVWASPFFGRWPPAS
ncbi:MAG: hypothetical protein Ct9H300mP31_03970 [Acidimicrobiaceae bacterium]|nr:MAG: hypothetical protein Ct9H300mP31_03970 [Acidimicrobiaceae bacterium]